MSSRIRFGHDQGEWDRDEGGNRDDWRNRGSENRGAYPDQRNREWQSQGVNRWNAPSIRPEHGYEQPGEQGRYGRGGYGRSSPHDHDFEQRINENDWRGQGSSFGGGAYRGGIDRNDASDFSRRQYFGGDYERESRFGQAQGWQRPIGRPPKGYTRSDERIREDVSDRLADRIDASEITVEVRNGEVNLSGTVRARWVKHEAEHIADSVAGVKDITNQIRVQRDEPTYERAPQATAQRANSGIEGTSPPNRTSVAGASHQNNNGR
jgi:osmotically-inducible protein OsmY